jgi:Ca-activated chloride channel family protein
MILLVPAPPSDDRRCAQAPRRRSIPAASGRGATSMRPSRTTHESTGLFPARPAGRLLLGCLLLLASATLAAGDPGQAPSEPAAEPSSVDDETLQRLLDLHVTEQAEVRLVLLPAVVTNRKGRLVRGLTAGDFTLLEDYVPQEIRYFSTEATEPIAIVFLLDISGSMRQVGKLDEAKQAIRIFIDGLAPGDLFGLICFADDQVAWITELTADRERFLARLDVQRAYGQTALFDAVAATPRLVDEEFDGKRAIVLITDGDDNASRLNTFSASRLARSVDVPIYTIGFTSISGRMLPKGSRERSHRVLELFAAETGGRLFQVDDPADLKEAVITVQEELRFQYIIGYHPTRSDWDGSFRRVKLEPVRNGLKVRTRSGSYADP